MSWSKIGMVAVALAALLGIVYGEVPTVGKRFACEYATTCDDVDEAPVPGSP